MTVGTDLKHFRLQNPKHPTNPFWLGRAQNACQGMQLQGRGMQYIPTADGQASSVRHDIMQ